MLIIIEGVDGTGKSTLAQGLKALTGDVLQLHAAQPVGTWDEEYVQPLTQYVPTGKHEPPSSPSHVICDRWHWGELIYGPLYRGQSIVGPEEWMYVDSMLNAKGAIVVFLRNKKEDILQRWKDRGEDFAKAEHLDQLMSSYEYVAANSRVPVIRATNPRHSHMLRILTVASAFEESIAEARRNS